MKNKIKNIIAGFLVITGLSILLFPTIKQSSYQKKVDIEYEQFLSEVKNNTSDDDYINSELYNKMKVYNIKLYEENQKYLTNLASCEKETINLKKYGYDKLGFIVIPSIKVKLPIYNGASEYNMTRGATYMSQTSFPLGGNNTNTVICAHRRWIPAKMFNDLPKIKVGDTVTIINLWYNINYKVIKTEKIQAFETDKIKIQGNKEMLTLFTCCYYSTRKDRFLVYCERI